MADVLLENTNVFELKPEYSVAALRKKFGTEQSELKNGYNVNVAEKHRIQGAYEDMSADKEAMFDYDEKDLLLYKDEVESNQQHIIKNAAGNRNYAELLDRYENSFAALYQIKEQSEKAGETTKFSFVETEQKHPVGIITQEQYFEMSANPDGVTKELAMQVELPSGEHFDLIMPPYDKPGVDSKSFKAQLAFDNTALQELNAARLARIMEFCESHGLSTFQMDVPYSFDGNIDAEEKMKGLLQQLQEQNLQKNETGSRQEAENQRQHEKFLMQEAVRNGHNTLPAGISYDEPRAQEIVDTDVMQDAQAAMPVNNAPQPKQPKNTKPAKTIKDAEKGIEKFLEKGLFKDKDFNYFKEHTGLFGSGWTEYIVYDKSDPDNRKKDGIIDPKSGEAKFTYSFKIFVKEENGKFRFAYRTPGNKKIDDTVVNGLVGQFSDLGITHVRFPDGLQDVEKKLWRIALAEKGIVPVGMGLDHAKAEGMLKAAKEKLSTEAYRKFRYRLAVQMDKENKEKGKVVSPSEQDFIDGLLNSQKYLAFTEGYGNKLKGMLRDYLDKADINHDDGAVEKTAAYMAMRRLFDAYTETVDNVNILSSNNLSATEKQLISQAGLTGPVSEFSPAQIGQLYEIMMIKSKQDAKKEIDQALLDARDLQNQTSKGAKRADNVIIKEVFDGARNRFEKVNEMLTPLGVDEISFPKSFGRLHYDNFYREHPELMRRNTPQQTQNPNQNQPNQPNTATARRNNQAAQTFVQTLDRGRQM